MGEERLTRAESIFQSAADLPPGERDGLLSERCGDDAELRGLVERLLARHDDGMGSFLEPAPSSSTHFKSEEPPTQSASERIGPYILRDLIGAGGMGEVWKAEQTSPVRRTVALKLIKAGMDTKAVLARFEAERQALAMMNHPYIAKVHDAGVTERGRPYFVMEHVPGIPITDYCDQRRLDTKERLELFERVCEGVQHAHQKAVIHRDIKPTNILVADVDGKPLPKIIDFGVAKATTHKLTEKTMHTALGQIIGTPEYMSPEQADLTSEDVDTRTDVYSLGVVLYKLLVGGLPFESDELRQAGLEGILRTLREKDPPRPSTKISTLGERTSEIAKRRRTEPRRLAGQLKGDLDWIVMRALDKDRNRRYGSPQELAQDIQRHLSDQPVLAGPPSAVYRSRKFVKRHRVGVGSAAAIFLAVAVGFAVVAVQKAEIAAARDEAMLVTTSLEEMLASVDPRQSGRVVTVREMLDQTAKTLGEKFEHQPLAEARLRHTVGKTYYALGEYNAAEEHLRRAVEIRGERLGDEDLATLAARNDRVRAFQGQFRYRDAEVFARETLEIGRRVFGAEHPQTLDSMSGLAAAYEMQGRYEEAEALGREALEISRRVFGEEHPHTLLRMRFLAGTYYSQDRYHDAGALRREALEISRRVLGEGHPRTLDSMTEVATGHDERGRYEEAEALQREALEISRRVHGEDHPETLQLLRALAFTLKGQGRLDETEALLWEALRTGRRVLGEEHPETLAAMSIFANLHCVRRHYDEAEALERELLKIRRRVLGEDHPITNSVRYDIACHLAMQDRRSEAVSFLRAALDNRYRQPDLWILDDPELASLHGDPEFEAIVEELRRRNEEASEAD